MSEADLRARMEEAAAACDFEEAGRLRDQIGLLRGGTEAPPDTRGLIRQRPGAMGLGSSRQRVEPPPGWVKPKKPDPMTKGQSRRRPD